MDYPAYSRRCIGGVLASAGACRLVLALAALLAAPHLGAQGIASLISPGKLSKPHAKLEGLDKCQSCHEPGRQVAAVKCLECHKPVGERIKAKKGVHRDVTTTCTRCHPEHAGLDGDLRHFEPKRFDHTGQAEFRARRPARAARLQGLPQDALVPRPLGGVRVLPQGRPQRRSRHDLPDLPRDERRLQGDAQELRPLQDEIPADRRPREAAVRELPQDEGRLPDRALRGL